jgi:hypothetical protein
MRGDTAVTADKKQYFNRSRGSGECDARTDDVFEAFQFPRDERAGGPCCDKGRRQARGKRRIGRTARVRDIKVISVW